MREEGIIIKTVDNPCYHCYTRAIDECTLAKCKHRYEEWARNLDEETTKNKK